MSNQQKNQANAKAIYTKPTLIEYGSLAERTKIFGFQNPAQSIDDNPNAIIAVSITSTAI